MGRSWRPSRTVIALVGLGLLLLAGLFLGVLVANWADNAYLDLAMIGVLLVLASSPFILAAILPDHWSRRILLYLGVGVLCVVGLLGAAILINSLLVIPSQDYRHDPRVLGRHLIALVVLSPSVLGALVLLFGARHGQ
jgi:hypothetical protein